MHNGCPRVSNHRRRSRRPLHPGLMETLLTVRELRKTYRRGGGVFSQESEGARFTAVDGLSFTVARGETFAVVGESGCGKTTLARMLLRLIELDGGEIVAEPLAIHEPGLSGTERLARAAAILDRVGINEDAMPRYPHEFSGGQRQRIGIARALILQPKLIVADEPVSALDVSVGAQVLLLLQELQREFALTYIFISHSLPVVAQVATRIAVMRAGRFLEIGAAEVVLHHPRHDYTRELLAAVPELPRA